MVGVLTPALTIAKTASTAAPRCRAGPCTYTITVTNTGQIPYTAAASRHRPADPASPDNAAYQGDAAAATTGASTISLSYAAPEPHLDGEPALGAAVTITYTVIVNNPDTADLVLTNTVTSAAAGSNCVTGTEPGCTATVGVVVAPGTLTFTSQAGVNTAAAPPPAAAETYTITVANAAASPYTGASFTRRPDRACWPMPAYNNDAASDRRRGRHRRLHQPEPDLVRGRPGVRVRSPSPSPSTVQQRCHQQHGPVQHAHLRLSRHQLPPTGGTGDPRCSTSVGVAQLAISASTERDDDDAGRGRCGYTFTFTNTGSGALHRHHDRQRRDAASAPRSRTATGQR